MAGILLAGTHSGVGKTTVTMGIIAALRQRGLTVQPFKTGPDFIDAGHLAALSGHPCRNLDSWMLNLDVNRRRLAEASGRTDVVLVEGMMGLFDGVRGDSDAGSSAEIARELGLPVVLVVDASAAARSLAATVLGFSRFDPRLPLAGVIFNRVAGPGHEAYLRQAMQAVPDVPVIGACRSAPELHIPERHLGLTTAEETMPAQRLRAYAEWAEGQLDVGRLLELAGAPSRPAPQPVSASSRSAAQASARIAIARDAAFCFYYPENLEALEDAGAELMPFSPLTDGLPPDCDGVYLGGGYPELHAAALSANRPLLEELRAFAAAGKLMYAECGGLMYLAQAIETAGGESFAMAGVLPFRVRMRDRLAAIGYRELTPIGFGEAGFMARGHEFHHSEIIAESLTPEASGWHAAFRQRASDGSTATAGWSRGGVFASYIHIHFASAPEFVGYLLDGAGRQERHRPGVAGCIR